MASGAHIAQPAFAVAARAGEAEFHGARHLRHVAGAIALGTNGRVAARRSGAIAGLANFLARSRSAHLRPADGLPEIDVHPVFQVRAFFRAAARLLAARVAEELAEDVAEASRAAAAGAAPHRRRLIPVTIFRKIEAAEAHARLTGARSGSAARTARRNVVRVETVLIVDLALLGIAQDVIGFLNLLEALLGGLVAGVQIRMILARQLAVRLADLVLFGARDTPSVS